jgi:NADPH:quinone reductase-like Zn-dependent oxidoreductase
VGTAAVQLAKLAGARVLAVTSGRENVERVEGLGADVVYDRLEGDFSRRAWAETRKRGVDLVFDTVGEAIWPSCLRALAVQGRLVTSGATTGASGETEIRLVFWKQLSILGSTMGSPREFRRAMQLVFEGRVAPVIHEVMPLADAGRAHALLEEGTVFGKLVLVP